MELFDVGETVCIEAKVAGVQIKGRYGKAYYNLTVNGLKIQLPEDKVHALPPLDFPNDHA